MTIAQPKTAPGLENAAGIETNLTTVLTPVRRESRRDEVRAVAYTPFPRVHGDQPRLGFTRDISPLGMCLVADAPEPIGSLFRVHVRQLDGQPMGATIARVVWRMATVDGRYWLGLDLLCETDGGRSQTLPQNPQPEDV